MIMLAMPSLATCATLVNGPARMSRPIIRMIEQIMRFIRNPPLKFSYLRCRSRRALRHWHWLDLSRVGVFHARLLDRAGELERGLVVVLQPHRRAEVNAEIKAVVGGETQRCADRHHARR